MILQTKLLGVIALLAGFAQAEVIKEEFNSIEDVKTFWNISSWGSAKHQYASENVTVVDSVLLLKLNASPSGTKPVGGEIQSKRTDFKYGSYRASIKTTDVAGSVIGLFVYKDGIPGDGNLHEVDMEILTKNSSDMYYTLHHDGYSTDHTIKDMGFDPSLAFHEYRFDWHPDSVSYYIDGVHTVTLTKKIPDAETAMLLNHWSKNLANWGGPAPTEDTWMYVDYMHYYSLDELPVDDNTVALSSPSVKDVVWQDNWQAVNVLSLDGKLIEEWHSATEVRASFGNVRLLLQIKTENGVVFQNWNSY